jgi:hypothetical protein
MAFELIPVTPGPLGEGEAEGDEIGEFRGSVIAIALRDTDPLSAPKPRGRGHRRDRGAARLGHYFLVCDPEREAPVWVEKEGITSQKVGSGLRP